MTRAYYSDYIANFRISTPEEIIGKLAICNEFPLEQSQRDAWREEISILQGVLASFQGSIYFEYSIPRMVESKGSNLKTPKYPSIPELI